jgi:diguanylate cyclase (GGDEF)-like protein
MARRNGRGSKSLAETITQFERTQIRLLKAVEEAQILTEREAERLGKRFEKSSAQKRSSDVLAAAIHMNKLLCASLKERPEETDARRGGELDVLGEISAALREEENAGANLDRILGLMRELIPYGQATVFLNDQSGEALRPVASVGGVVDLIQGVEFERGSGFSAWVASRQKPILLADLQRPPKPGEAPLRSFMSAPILVQGELMGVLNVGSEETRAFDDDHLRLLTIIAGMLAATLTRVAAERLLGRLAAHDPLTGVSTERFLDQRIYEEIDRSRRYGDALTLALFQIDDFATFTEQYGSKLTGQVFAEFSRLLKGSVRSCDPLGRVGDDQVAVLFVHTAMCDARTAATRVAKTLSTHSYPRRKRIRVSHALAAFPEGGEDLTSLVATARRRLQAAMSDPMPTTPTERMMTA